MTALPFVIGYDATHANISHLPKHAQVAGYTTGSPDIKWTAADWAAHPGAIRYDQDAAASDPSADILDVERGAATFKDCPAWASKAMGNYQNVVRPGQRWPAIYMSQGNVTAVVNALIAGGIVSGINLVVANWSLTEDQAIADVEAAAGPFPLVGLQFTDSPGFYDIGVYSRAWLEDVSGGSPAPDPAPKPGVYRHLTDGKSTPNQLAASRSEPLSSLVSFSVAHYTAADWAAFGVIVGVRKARKGLAWYSVRP